MDILNKSVARTFLPDGVADADLFGFGELGDKKDRVGSAGVAGNVLELRRMPQGLDYRRWRSFALALFDYVSALNAQEENPNLDTSSVFG